jgi:hypothetical protein
VCDESAPDRPLYRFVVRSRGRLLFRLSVESVRHRDELIPLLKDRFPAPAFSVTVEQASWRSLGDW